MPLPTPLVVAVAIGAATALSAGVWGGLARLGILAPNPGLATDHGPLMVLGFLGTVIALERAVALGRWWSWVAPAAVALGAVLLVFGAPGPALAASAVGGGGLVVASVVAATLDHRQTHTILMGLAAVAWPLAAVALAAGASVPATVSALAVFPVLTVLGERIELSRFGPPRPPGWRRAVVASGLVMVVGALWSFADPGIGTRLTGLGLTLGAVAGFVGDLARRTIRTAGIGRYMAAGMLAAYGWLAASGVVWALGWVAPGTTTYDPALHGVFLGFVFSMVFAHAPVIIPAVSGARLAHGAIWWLPLGLLHASLATRIAGTLTGSQGLVVAGAVANAAAVALFAAVVVTSARRHPARRATPPPTG